MRRHWLIAAAFCVAGAAHAEQQDWNGYISQEFGRLQSLVAKKSGAQFFAPNRNLTPLLIMARQHWNELTPATQALAKPWMSRPTDTNGDTLSGATIKYSNPSVSIPATHFRIHYIDKNTYPSDPNAATPTYASQVGQVMDAVWAAEHTTLGYAAVPEDTAATNNGGDKLYDVYLANLGGFQLYGYVYSNSIGTTDPSRPNGSYSYMVLDNNYAEFPYADFMDPLQVTAAHEYFHAVQFGYDYQEDSAFMEQSSTWMEDMVYPNIHDNYQYLGEPYTDTNGDGQYTFGETYTERNGNGQRDEGSKEFPEVPLDGFGLGHATIQYGRFLWPRYLTEKYPNADIMRVAWENCGKVQGSNAFSAINDALLAKVGVTLKDAYQDYAAWGYDTAQYDQGAAYPVAYVDGSSNATATFSSATSPSLDWLRNAGEPVQLHLSTLYEQVTNPSGTYTFSSTGGDPAVTMIVRGSNGALTYEPVVINGGTGTWTAPAGATKAVAVISNASATADGMAWTFCSGACDLGTGGGDSGGASDGGGGGGALDFAMLAIGLGALARRRAPSRG